MSNTVNHLKYKPRKFRNYLTVGELAELVGRDVSRIRKLEKEGKIPQASRVQCGQIEVRLWSPAQVEEIQRLFDEVIRPGRPSADE